MTKYSYKYQEANTDTVKNIQTPFFFFLQGFGIVFGLIS